MGQTATEVRQDIERTRDQMSDTIEAIADRTKPTGVLRRQRSRLAARFKTVRNKVMGTAERAVETTRRSGYEAVETTRRSGQRVAENISEAPERVGERLSEPTQGNPLAAGIVAFGGGLLASYLVPSSQAERRAARQVREETRPAIEKAKEAGKDVAGEVHEKAQRAADDVKQSAAESAREVADDAKAAAEQVQQQAATATDDVAEKAKSTRR